MLANKIILNDKVLIDLTEDTAVEADVLEGKTFHKADGSIAVGTAINGAALNIHCGDTPPEDTSMLWVRTKKASKITIARDDSVDIITFTEEAMGGKLYRNINDLRCAVVGDKIYIFFNKNNNKTIQVYDIKTDTVTTLGVTYPSSYYSYSLAVVDKTIYAFGGFNSGRTDAIVMLDTLTDTISTSDVTLPRQMSNIAAVANGTKVYLLGGTTGADNGRAYLFDTVAGSISEIRSIGNLYTTYSSNAHVIINDVIYLVPAGTSGASTTSIVSYDIKNDVLECYDGVLEAPTQYAKAFAIDDRFIYISGCNLDHSAVYIFDTVTKRVDRLSKKQFRSHYLGGCVSNDGYGYLIAGYDETDYNCQWISRIKCDRVNLPKGDVAIKYSAEKNLFRAIDSATIQIDTGVEQIYVGDDNNFAEYGEAALYKDGTWTFI